MKRILIVLIYMSFSILAVRAQDCGHHWKMVPGRKDTFVDMASIKPSGLPARSRQGVPFWDTVVTVKSKNHLIAECPVDCQPGVTLDPGDGEYYIDARLIGRTPDAKIREMVCPLRHPH